MEFAAFGSLRLSVHEFHDLTPREFNHRLRAAHEFEEREWERTAQLACWVCNPWLPRGQKMSTKKMLRKAKQRASKE